MIVGGVILFVIGAILAFGVSFAVPGIAFPTIGGILMAAGAVLFIVGLVLRLRGTTTTERTSVDPNSGTAVRRTTRAEDDRP
ncbi:MAG: hypothetical protein HY996_09775 [Micrococcales bacterium]|nr:hypothetical protein [Micrococcales bacterium]